MSNDKAINEARTEKQQDRNGLLASIKKLEEIVRASAEAGCPISQTYIEGFAKK